MVRSFAPALLATTAAVVPAVLAGSQFTVQTRTPAPAQAASPDVVSSHVLTIRKSGKASKSSAHVKALLAGPDANGKFTWSQEYGLTNVDNLESEEYTAEIEWAGVPVDVIVDSGSSDTWLIQKGFQCVTSTGVAQPEADCYFGPVFNGTYQHGQIPDVNFQIEYADLEFLSGTLGYEDVTVAGITVDRQTVALANSAYWEGDGVTSGLMGLAYASLTDEYAGTNVSADNPNVNMIEYDPIFTTMVKQDSVPAVFSMALERNSDNGLMAFGGLPPVQTSGKTASTPIIIADLIGINYDKTQYSFYTIQVEGLLYQGPSKGDKPVNFTNTGLSIIDSGTTLAYLPTKLVLDVAKLFDPPAVNSDYFGGLAAACNATAPYFAVQIGGVVFEVSAADLIFQEVSEPGTDLCLLGLQDGGNGSSGYILGNTFMNNVVSIFDVGASEMRFVAHDY